MNLNKALDKAYEGKSLAEVLKSPVDAIQGLSEGDAVKIKEAFGIDTVEELATNKYFLIAQAIYDVAKYEE